MVQDESNVIHQEGGIYTAPYFRRVSRIIYDVISFHISKEQGILYYMCPRLAQDTSVFLLKVGIREVTEEYGHYLAEKQGTPSLHPKLNAFMFF